MTRKEMIEMLKDAYDTGCRYGRLDAEEFTDEEKLDQCSWESFIEQNESRLTTDVPDTSK
jgi:hypothetical protein